MPATSTRIGANMCMCEFKDINVHT